MGAIEIVSDKSTQERFAKEHNAGERCRNFCFENGLVMRAVGDSMIVAPPEAIMFPLESNWVRLVESIPSMVSAFRANKLDAIAYRGLTISKPAPL